MRADSIDLNEYCDGLADWGLHGYWKDEHDTLSPVPAHLQRGVAERAKRYLDSLAHVRDRVIPARGMEFWRFEAEALL